ncbi:hypothetical protein [uncultured Ilyobacter sp.]|uniref:hypothetical protein n=1 Tax=uncultured Ilyobacter sp. TaxID=544433 RepID=UPI0029F4B0D2|nr:hypothetical protein [uncultured Ilyobacter sp.]
MERCEGCFIYKGQEDLMEKYKEIQNKIYLSPLAVTIEEIEFYHKNRKIFDRETDK